MEQKQIIISVSREFGSGGHVVARNLAERFQLPLYDYNIIQEIACSKNVDAEDLEQYDEIPKNRFFSRSVAGHTNSPEENVAHMQFNFIKKKAKDGESFVVVGRCSEEILKGTEGLITIFILGDKDFKIERTASHHQISNKEAEKLISENDKKRRNYHDYFCSTKWGDARNYDMTINVSKLGIDVTTDIIEEYIKKRLQQR